MVLKEFFNVGELGFASSSYADCCVAHIKLFLSVNFASHLKEWVIRWSLWITG